MNLLIVVIHLMISSLLFYNVILLRSGVSFVQSCRSGTRIGQAGPGQNSGALPGTLRPIDVLLSKADADLSSASSRLGVDPNGLSGSACLDQEVAQGAKPGGDEGVTSPPPGESRGDPNDAPMDLKGSIYVSQCMSDSANIAQGLNDIDANIRSARKAGLQLQSALIRA
jgi:hypothetical protein